MKNAMNINFIGLLYASYAVKPCRSGQDLTA
jgi:hypothetical protein